MRRTGHAIATPITENYLMPDHTQDPSDTSKIELMTRYGITRVPTEEFRYKSYRYTNLTDALSQAKRDSPAP
jgi:hypothetical protein